MIEPTIFLGPPGTGKTTTLLDTVEGEMANGVPPDRIGFMTFTKRGVEEAVTRASKRFSLDRKQLRYFNTLHSAALRHVGILPSKIFTGKRVHQFGLEHGLELFGGLSSDDGTYSNFYGDDLVLFLENYARITQTPITEVLSKFDFVLPDAERAWKIIQLLREYKLKEGLYDFTDMIEEFIKLDDPPRLEVLFVDEAQDLSELQWTMVFQLARHVKRMYIAGDDDQTIFTWAGASERFITMSGHVSMLQQSYRVPRAVHTLANRIIQRVSKRRPKLWNPRDADGSFSTVAGISQLDPGRLDPELGSVMMLGRTVKMIRTKFIPYCRAYGIPYRYFENNSIKPTQATAIDAWITLHQGGRIPADAAVRIYDLLPSEGHKLKPGVKHGFKARLKRIADQEDPPQFSMEELRHDYGLIAEGTWEDVFVQIETQDREYLKKVIEKGYSLTNEPNVHISTIHRVKGGQADTVILLSDTAKATDKYFTTSQDDESRVFYTGITRTKEDLIVVSPDKHRYFGGLYE